MAASMSMLLGLIALFNLLSHVYADPSYGCDNSAPKPVSWEPKAGEARRFKVNDRDIRVTMPDVYNQTKPSPIIVVFHDKEMSLMDMEYTTGLWEGTVNRDMITVYPEARDDQWQSDIMAKREKGKQAPDDISFAQAVLRDLETMLCIDTNRIYAAGLGTGGGMMHLLACDPTASKKIAAFAAVGAGFGVSRNGKGPWGSCEPARKPVPLLEIHGEEDGIFGYLLSEGESGKKRMTPGIWLEEWAERNGCGEPVGEPVANATDEATLLTRLEGGGLMSQSAVYAGGATRMVKSCNRKASETKNKNEKEVPLEEEKLDDITLLHYALRGFGHGWPRQQLKNQEEVIIAGSQVKPSGTKFFDTTKVILDFFNGHTLPKEHGSRPTISDLDTEAARMHSEEESEEVANNWETAKDAGKDEL